MVNYNEMKKKFQPKDPVKAAAIEKSHKAAKAIAREYDRKRNEAGLNEKFPHRGPIYYMILVLVMVLFAGAFIALMTGTVTLGKPRISKAEIQVHQSIDALAIALGRYKFHCGVYPTTDEGLQALAAITPKKKGWFGPYIKKVVPDPWGSPYQYWVGLEDQPVLLSMGPDRKMGTDDDVLPDPKLYTEPFRDTTWTNHWVPYNLRGIVVAPDEKTKKAIQEEVKKY